MRSRIRGCREAARTPISSRSSSAVFHFSAIVTACSYGFGAWPLSIWYQRKWSTAFKGTLDGILYGLATGAVYMWMWPKA
jgi:hypothetical protein